MSIFEQATNTVKSCILPQLTVKIGDQFIGKENFEELQPILRDNLQRLLDIFHAYEHELLAIDYDTFEFRKHFIILLCEQSTSYETIFQVYDEFIRGTLKTIANRYVLKICMSDEGLLKGLFEYYHTSLSKDTWKYNLGGINGFLTFIQLLYENSSNLTLDYDKAQFILATGLNILDHFEPHIQIIGIKLFNILLNGKNVLIVKEQNMDQVILEDTQKLILKLKEIDHVTELWDCLYACCLIGIEKYEPSKWSKFDDIFESLMQRLAVEGDKSLIMVYLNYLNKFSFMEQPQFSVFGQFMDLKSLRELVVVSRQECLQDFTKKGLVHAVIQDYVKKPTFGNLRVFRWIKKLMLIIQNQVRNIGGPEEDVVLHVFQLHILYCLTVFTVPPRVLGKTLTDLQTNLIPTLVCLWPNYQLDNFIGTCSMDFLMTIKKHLDRITDTENTLYPNLSPMLQIILTEKEETEFSSQDLTNMQQCQEALTMIMDKMNIN